MEKIEADSYRKGLASSVKELRNLEEDGKEKGKKFLELAQETSLYKEAKEIHQTERVVKSENAQENKEEEIIAELMNLIATNPDYMFGVAANGRLGSPYIKEGSAPGLGNMGYIFDPQTQFFKTLGNNDAGRLPDPRVYDNPGERRVLREPYFTSYQRNLENGDSVIHFKSSIDVPFVPGNTLTADARGDHTFAGGLYVRANSPTVTEVVSQDLYDVIENGKSAASREVIWKFLVTAFEKYTPEWWGLVKEEWQKEPGNRGKDIKDVFNVNE